LPFRGNVPFAQRVCKSSEAAENMLFVRFASVQERPKSEQRVR
jgi:hypothetical protein